MNEINLESDEQIVINYVQYCGRFFEDLRSVKYNNQPVIVVPNNNDGAHGVSYRSVVYDDIRDQEIADALKLYTETLQNHKIEQAESIYRAAEFSLSEAKKTRDEIMLFVTAEILLYVRIKTAVLEIVERILEKTGRDK